MGLFDVDGFGESQELETIKVKESEKVFKSNDFDKSITDDVSPLLKMEIINKNFHLGSLLKNLGIDISNGTMYCPFHDDKATGKPSAKYHENTDLLYCFSENKMYSAYHAIKFLYNKDVNKIFQKIWLSMSEVDRHEYMDKYNVQGTTVKEKTKWDELSEKVLSKFKSGQVNYKQYKNALYKVLMIVKDDKSSSNSNNQQEE